MLHSYNIALAAFTPLRRLPTIVSYPILNPDPVTGRAQDRDPTHNAACLTKFTELLLLNGIISTQQMWTVFNLVGDLFEGAGEGFPVRLV